MNLLSLKKISNLELLEKKDLVQIKGGRTVLPPLAERPYIPRDVYCDANPTAPGCSCEGFLNSWLPHCGKDSGDAQNLLP